MKNIEIPDLLYSRLEAHATFQHNTPAAVIAKWADIIENKPVLKEVDFSGLTTPQQSTPDIQLRRFDVMNAPSLVHTRAWGHFDGVEFRKWNDLVRIAHVKAFDAIGSFEGLARVTHAQIKKGAYSGEGYRPVGDRDFSIQNVDSNHAWKYSFTLARQLKVPIHVNLEWRDKDGAQFPGQKGVLAWSPA